VGDELANGLRKQALEKVRQAGNAIDASHWLGIFASTPNPQLSATQREQRKAFLAVSAKLVDTQLDTLMDEAVAEWILYKKERDA
jgi:hypothetical protein